MTSSSNVRITVGYFVPPSEHFAGIERVVHEIASGLAERHPQVLDVHVIFASPYDEELLRNSPYTSHVLGASHLRQVGRALRRCVAENDIQVLVTPQVEATVIAWTATRGTGQPVLVPHLHGNPRLEEAEGTWRTRAAFTVFRHVIARLTPIVVAVSPSLRDYASQSLAPRSSVVFAPNPVRDLHCPPWQPSPHGQYRFLSVGRLCRQKGQDLLLRGLAHARPNLPPVSLTLVGQGPAEAELRRLSTELGLDDIVTFAGYTSDPAQHLRAADCFVSASRWEGFGVAIVEALQCGLPVLATDCDFGPADIINNDALGALVVADDPAALADGLVQAVEWTRQPDQVAQRGAAASAYDRGGAVSAHFSILRAVAPVQ